jgi:hypothetical protein
LLFRPLLCRSLLKKGSVSLVPGGIAEMFLWEQDRESIKVCRSKQRIVEQAICAALTRK